VVPVSKGGPTTMDNLVTACRECNLGKGTMDVV
jgi:5-methylcytosine-specific restriction endonuclease McrA